MKNLGHTDRSLRIFIGSLLILLTLLNVIGPLGWLGLVPIATGVLSFCPAYRILGLRSCPAPAHEDHA